MGACNPKIIENNRSRCSILIEKINENDITSVIVDTGPDFRSQMNRENIKKIDAVFYTHEHADHTHGIDDLRMYALRDKKRVDVFASKPQHRKILGKNSVIVLMQRLEAATNLKPKFD